MLSSDVSRFGKDQSEWGAVLGRPMASAQTEQIAVAGFTLTLAMIHNVFVALTNWMEHSILPIQYFHQCFDTMSR